MQFTYKGISVEVPEGRLEVCRLKDKFDDFAAGMRDEVMNSFDENFADMRAFLAGCDEWAHGFIDRGADMVIRELAALDCYDMDREEWIAKHIDYSTWDASTKPYRKMVAELDAEEAEKEVKRAARTEDWGNTYSEHKVTIHAIQMRCICRDSLRAFLKRYRRRWSSHCPVLLTQRSRGQHMRSNTIS